MRSRVVRAGLLLCALSALWPAATAAQPASGPREVLDQSFTATRPGAPTGINFTGAYHAAGNKKGNPPYLKRMIFYPPPGLRYDTSVPARCSAPDAVLQVAGPAACPAGSRIGGGTVEGIFYYPIEDHTVFDHYHHNVDVMNAANQQIVLVKSEGYTVVRGQVHSDSSIEFNTPTCFPAPPTGCVDDYILQLRASTILPVYKKTSGGHVRSYVTTPAKCPASGHWQSPIRIWWGNGKVDTMMTKQPCAAPRRAGGPAS